MGRQTVSFVIPIFRQHYHRLKCIVNSWVSDCCWSIKMSSLNWSVKMSSHGHPKAAPTPAAGSKSANSSIWAPARLLSGHRDASQPAPGPDFVLKPQRAPHVDRRQRLHASRSASPAEGCSVGMGEIRPGEAPPRRPRPQPARSTRLASTHPWRQPFPLSRQARVLMAARRG